MSLWAYNLCGLQLIGIARKTINFHLKLIETQSQFAFVLYIQFGYNFLYHSDVSLETSLYQFSETMGNKKEQINWNWSSGEVLHFKPVASKMKNIQVVRKIDFKFLMESN